MTILNHHVGDWLILIAMLSSSGLLIGWMWRQVLKLINGGGKL